jgi:hypothetical protein
VGAMQVSEQWDSCGGDTSSEICRSLIAEPGAYRGPWFSSIMARRTC